MKDEIFIKAREWIDTPYHHQARCKGVGCDCIGLVIGVCKELGRLSEGFDFFEYDRTPDSTTLMQMIEAHCIETDTPEPGDIHIFRIKRNPQHIAIISDTGIIHAYESAGSVKEHPLDPKWESRIIKSFILPERV